MVWESIAFDFELCLVSVVSKPISCPCFQLHTHLMFLCNQQTCSHLVIPGFT